jgi:hypothetical protein
MATMATAASDGKQKRGGYVKGGILLGAALAIAVGCTTQSPSASPVTVLGLWSEPESQLLYPGSEVLDKREHEAGLTMEDEVSASVGYLLGSADDAALVEDFYASQLTTSGWRLPDDNEARSRGIRTTAELMARAWRKGDLVFRLGILDKSHPAAEGPSEGFETVFRIDLIAKPAKPSPSKSG